MRAAKRGYTLLEVLVAVAILIAGVAGILQILPRALATSREATVRAQAAVLAENKLNEIRRDDNLARNFALSIATLEDPTELVVFPADERLAYQFHSRSAFSPDVDDPNDPRDDFNVPRIIVRYNPAFRPSADVLFELRFDR